MFILSNNNGTAAVFAVIGLVLLVVGVPLLSHSDGTVAAQVGAVDHGRYQLIDGTMRRAAVVDVIDKHDGSTKTMVIHDKLAHLIND